MPSPPGPKNIMTSEISNSDRAGRWRVPKRGYTGEEKVKHVGNYMIPKHTESGQVAPHSPRFQAKNPVADNLCNTQQSPRFRKKRGENSTRNNDEEPRKGNHKMLREDGRFQSDRFINHHSSSSYSSRNARQNNSNTGSAHAIQEYNSIPKNRNTRSNDEDYMKGNSDTLRKNGRLHSDRYTYHDRSSAYSNHTARKNNSNTGRSHTARENHSVSKYPNMRRDDGKKNVEFQSDRYMDNDRALSYSMHNSRQNYSNTGRSHATREDHSVSKYPNMRRDNKKANGRFQSDRFINHDTSSSYSNHTARQNNSNTGRAHAIPKDQPVLMVGPKYYSNYRSYKTSRNEKGGANHSNQKRKHSKTPTIAGLKRSRDQQSNQLNGQVCSKISKVDAKCCKGQQINQALTTTTIAGINQSRDQINTGTLNSTNNGEPNLKKEEAVNECEESTHVIFCIDFSGSMRIKDVKTSNKDRNIRISRWEAVFNCAHDFVSEQAKLEIEKKEGLKFSLIIFNEESKVIFERVPLGCQRDERYLKERLRDVCSGLSPCKGTAFSPAFKCIQEVASGSTGPVMVVFLSDGRPADLPIGKHTFPILREYKSHGKMVPSVKVHIENLQRDHGDNLSLQFVCIFNQGRPWLEKLASEFDGTFHMSDLNVCAIVPEPTTSETLAVICKPLDKDVEIIGHKSAETQQCDRHNAAIAAGNIIELTSSMQSTFRTISTTLSTMRTSAAGESNRLQERGVVLESVSGLESNKVKFEATRMVLHPSEQKFVVPEDETSNGRIVSISTQPFAQGGLRNVYHMTEILKSSVDIGNNKKFAAKESRHIVPYTQRLAFHRDTVKCQVRAVELASMFNQLTASHIKEMIPKVNFLEAEVYRLKDSDTPGGYRYLAVENSLVGRYLKYNSNNGYIMRPGHGSTPEDIKSIDVAQAFSHFTFEESKQDEIVVDIQGIYCTIHGCTYTDPQLHSKSNKYGRADRGVPGISDFFESHVCGSCCTALGLTNRKKNPL